MIETIKQSYRTTRPRINMKLGVLLTVKAAIRSSAKIPSSFKDFTDFQGVITISILFITDLLPSRVERRYFRNSGLRLYLILKTFFTS